MMKMMYNFYDTCSLLLRADDLFSTEENIVISSVTLNELEGIKTSYSKDWDTKLAARKILSLLELNPDKYECWIFRTNMLEPIEAANLDITNDTKILACAIDYDSRCHPDETIFVTNDLSLRAIAQLFFGTDSIQSVKENVDEYKGYKDVVLDNDKMAD